MMRGLKLVKYVVLLGILLVLPYLIQDQYSRHILNMIFIYYILAMSTNLVFGYTGGLTFGQVPVYAIGAYVSALMGAKLGLSFLPSFFLAGLAGILVGIVIGVPTLRLAGPYFAMATIGFHKIMEIIFLNWESVTGGPSGITGIPYPVIFGIPLKTEERYYYLILTVTLILFVLYRNLIKSHLGKTITAMRDNAVAASAMGVNVSRLRITVFTVSTFYAALAGSLYAHMVKYVAPEAFPMGESITLLIMVVLGGPGFLMGPIYGGTLVVLANEYLQYLESFNMLVFGIAIIVLLVFLPSGIAGLIERFRYRLSGRKEGVIFIREVGIEEMK
jgi:branched-chain amino acid transport system permease protein